MVWYNILHIRHPVDSSTIRKVIMTTKSDFTSSFLAPRVSLQRLATNATVSTLELLANLAEATLGKDFLLSGVARVSTPRRRALAVANAAVLGVTTAANALAVKNRLTAVGEAESYLQGYTAETLKSNIASASARMVLNGSMLVTGKRVWPRKSLSRYGRAYAAIMLAADVLSFAENTRELYRRSPEAQQRVALVRLMTPVIARSVMQKVTRRNQNADAPSAGGSEVEFMEQFLGNLTEEDIARMFTDDPDQ